MRQVAPGKGLLTVLGVLLSLAGCGGPAPPPSTPPPVTISVSPAVVGSATPAAATASPTPLPAPAPDSSDILDLPPPPADARIPYGPDPQQFGDLRLPSGPGPYPVVVVIHGGYWHALYDLGYIGHLCAALTQAGVATWNLEYRRLGNAGGGWPGTFLDVGQGIDYLRTLAPQYRLDLTRVVVVGHSAGGQLALWAAGRARIPANSSLHSADPLPVRGAAALAGVVDLQQG